MGGGGGGGGGYTKILIFDIIQIKYMYSATEQESTFFYNFAYALILTSNEQK